jgi:hypothetical protein
MVSEEGEMLKVSNTIVSLTNEMYFIRLLEKSWAEE